MSTIAPSVDTLRGPGAVAWIDGQPYRLLRALRVGCRGISYSAVDRSTASTVEVRSLLPDLDPLVRTELAARRRLLDLIWHPVARRIRALDLNPSSGAMVLAAVGEESFSEWAEQPEVGLAQILANLLQVAECLTEAHHVGLTHGGLTPDQIELVEGEPRLDFTGFFLPPNMSLAVGSWEGQEEDCRAFAGLLHQVLHHRAPDSWPKPFPPRLAAQLKQFGAYQDPNVGECPAMETFARLLRDVVARLDGVNVEAEMLPNAVAAEHAIAAPWNARALTGRDQERTAEVDLVLAPAEATPGRRNLQSGDQIGRYRIEEPVGEGGMGTVYRAVDLGTGETVALKVLSQATAANQTAVRRFAKEARLLATLQNPFITNLIEVNDECGLHYIVMEYVEGIDLRRALRAKGRLPQTAALHVIADVARGLVDAHQHGIVHRDIKPENILLLKDAESPTADGLPHAKLTDFGIARFVQQTESLAMTQAGSFLGTPTYVSPEQCRGQADIGPPSDVYSLGVTLYELLAGSPPFVADDPVTLLGNHCFDPPPELRKRVPEISEPVVALIEQCLAKQPEQRFADAGQLLRAVERFLRGEPAQATLRPVLPPHAERDVVAVQMSWSLRSTPAQLWRHVSNTERLNHAMGLPTVAYRFEQRTGQGPIRWATIQLGGMTLTWQEHPFEWIEGQRMSVLREFTGGPFRWLVSSVELLPCADQGTELIHTVRILPSHWLGRILARIQTGKKLRGSLERVYRRIDETMTHAVPDKFVDPYQAPVELTKAQREAIRQASEDLAGEGVSWEITEKLTEYLLLASDTQVAKIRPVALAREWKVDETELLETLLLAVRRGLLEMSWDLLCPSCRVAADSRPSLREIESHAHCEACELDFSTDVGNAVEMVLRVNPALRPVAQGNYCLGGPWHAPHVVMQLKLEPQETVEVELHLAAGDYVLRGPRLVQSVPVRVQPTRAGSELRILLGNQPTPSRTLAVRTGRQLVRIVNDSTTAQLVRWERTIPRDDLFTAARAAATPRFRELFPGELLASSRLASTEAITMIAVALPTIDALFAQCGEPRAYALVEQHLADATACLRRRGGEVVKVIGDTIFGSFHVTLHAVEAAFELAEREWTPPDSPYLPRAVGVHRGPALVTTANHQLDYFGATARQTMALPNAAGPGVALTDAVFAEPLIMGWLKEHQPRAVLRQVALPGKPEQLIQCFPVEVP